MSFVKAVTSVRIGRYTCRMATGYCVGRVGGLAVALGIGSAVALGWGACPAWADGHGGSAHSSHSAHRSTHDSAKKPGVRAAQHRDAPLRSVRKKDGPAATAATRAVSAVNGAARTAAPVAEPKLRPRADRPTPRSGAPERPEPTAAVAPAAQQITEQRVAAPPSATERSLTTPATPVMNLARLVRSADLPYTPATAASMLAALAAASEVDRRSGGTATAVAAQSVAAVTNSSMLADTSPNVLVIGVDGTNLSRILANPANINFFSLMQGGTTAPASIVGHTTISDPSWTAILTGVWGETAGVINNVYSPDPYNNWPTVFNQLETFNPGIETTAIANWDVIAAIAASGSVKADHINYISQIAGDGNWAFTDDAVGDATEAAILTADLNKPNFIFSYFVGVDENGHAHGGGSSQYADAITNVDRNLGEIMDAVQSSGEQWTVIVVTDHGHQASRGFGHGFQSPNETATFVIANNPDLFAIGGINTEYEIVDVTPTVMTLFGGTPSPWSQGVSLTGLGDSTLFPINNDAALRSTLQDLIAKNGYPNIGTDLSLGLRTVAATVPYVVYQTVNTIVGGLDSVGNQNIFIVSPLAQLASVGVQLVGNVLYAATNIVAQIVARLTGVTGASIFPLFPAPLPPLVGTQDPTSPTVVAAICTVPGSCAPTSTVA